jgi:hypothetical protein
MALAALALRAASTEVVYDGPGSGRVVKSETVIAEIL